MRASILIASSRERPVLQEVLRRALTQDFDARDYEVILVLDGREEPDYCSVERRHARCDFRVNTAPRRGQAASLNTGLEAAAGEIVLFLDDDTLCPPDLLAKHVAAHERASGNLVFGAILTSSRSARNLATAWLRNRHDGWFHEVTPDNCPHGWFFSFGNPNTSAPRPLLLACGGFDESFWRCNDTEFGFRLWERGAHFVYLPDAAVEHVLSTDVSDLVEHHAYEEGRGEARLCHKHPEYRRFSSLSGLSSGRNVRLLARRLLVGGFKVIDPALRVLCSTFIALPSRLARSAALRMISWRFFAHYYRGAIAECGSWNTFRRQFAERLPVLAYHRIGQRQRGEWYGLSISKSRLQQHLRWLRRLGRNSITVAQWLDWVERGSPLPPKPVLLTFDDGFAENTETALPVLQQHGFSVLTAVVTQRLGDVNQWDSDAGLPEFAIMRSEDVARWHAAGMEVASHSRSHPHLPELTERELESELAGSRADLSAVADPKRNVFVYPYGEYDDRVCERVARHYRAAFTLEGGFNHLTTDPMRLRRIMISAEDTYVDMWFYTNFGWSPLALVRRVLRSLPSRIRPTRNLARPLKPAATVSSSTRTPRAASSGRR